MKHIISFTKYLNESQIVNTYTLTDYIIDLYSDIGSIIETYPYKGADSYSEAIFITDKITSAKVVYIHIEKSLYKFSTSKGRRNMSRSDSNSFVNLLELHNDEISNYKNHIIFNDNWGNTRYNLIEEEGEGEPLVSRQILKSKQLLNIEKSIIYINNRQYPALARMIEFFDTDNVISVHDSIYDLKAKMPFIITEEFLENNESIQKFKELGFEVKLKSDILTLKLSYDNIKMIDAVSLLKLRRTSDPYLITIEYSSISEIKIISDTNNTILLKDIKNNVGMFANIIETEKVASRTLEKIYNIIMTYPNDTLWAFNPNDEDKSYSQNNGLVQDLW